MGQSALFPLPEPDAPKTVAPTKPEHARVSRPDRQQLQWAPRDLDAVLAQDHAARAIWELLEHLDLAKFYGSIKAVLDGPGRPSTDPQILLSLWIMASVEGIGSARQLDRLCREHDAYRWLCGGVAVNYHTLADFRVSKQAALDDLLTQIIASLMAAGAVKLERVAQDGIRVRASAGASSFRRKDKLEACLEEARKQVKQLAKAREHPDPGVSKRKQAALKRAAGERLARVEQALAYMPEAEATKELQRKRFAKEAKQRITEPRLSTTDPDARIMRMGDGGFRPAFNGQLATDDANGIILGVSVTASGSDAHQSTFLQEQIERRTGLRPLSYLMDGGFAVRDDITVLEERGIQVYAPVRLPKGRPESERYQPRYGDSPGVIAWRKRMDTDDGKEIYRQRAATAEWANAQVRQHGLTDFNVRGIAKVTSVLLLVAVTHDLMRWLSLNA